MREAKRAEPGGRGRFWSFRDGMQTLTDTLREQLADSADPWRPSSPHRIAAAAAGPCSPTARTAGTPTPSCLPARRSPRPKCSPTSTANWPELIGGIRYNRIAVVALGYQGRRRAAGRRVRLHRPAAAPPRRARRAVVLGHLPGSGPAGHGAVASAVRRLEPAGSRRLAGRKAGRRPCGRSCDSPRGVTAEPVFVHIVRWETRHPAVPARPSGAGRGDRSTGRPAIPGLFLGGNAYRGVALNDCTEQGGTAGPRRDCSNSPAGGRG